MRMMILASLFVLANATGADAGWLRNRLLGTHQRQAAAVRTRTVARIAEPNASLAPCPCTGATAAPAQAPAFTAPIAPAAGVIATAKAQAQARAGLGRSFHPGEVPAGCVEGTGYSSVSAADALANCCYSNSGLRLREQGVAFGRGGWYACRIFWK